MGSADVQVVWFKRDLRIHDHEPLRRAVAAGPVIPLYICEPELWRQPDTDACHWQFIADSLHELRDGLGRLGAPLITRSGDAVQVLSLLATEYRIETLWAYEETGSMWTYDRDRRVRRWARTNRVAFNELPRDFVVRRLTSRDDWGGVQRTRLAQPILPAPTSIRRAEPPPEHGAIPTLADLGLVANARTGVDAGGEARARQTLRSFLDVRCIGYEKRLSSPMTGWEGCSRLSSHLTYGTISLRQVISLTQRTATQERDKRFSLKAFGERTHWRSHFVQKLESEPPLEFRSYVSGFDRLRPDPTQPGAESAADRFDAWATGRTGFPMVDACMRSLLATGWINFRMRAMLVSFASYDLWLHWRPTALHLARAFVDYEPGIHYPQVQMQSGTTGINTIRIYDPVKQGLDHDPTGDFVRRWVPELAGVDGAAVHEPWKLGGTLFGRPDGYPEPIVNHGEAVAHAWKQVDLIKRQAQRDGTAQGIVEAHGSRRPPINRRSARRPPGTAAPRRSP
jgi:deoxyribodipyrimidine photo-lyase